MKLDVDAIVVTEATPSLGKTESGAAPGTAGMQYALGEKLGEGGFGVVHRVTRTTQVGTFEFALKFLDPSPFTLNHQKALERFKREVGAVQRLQHRAIVPYIDAGIDTKQRPYLVMALVGGTDFASAARAQPFATRAWMLAEVLRGIAHAHENGVLHRDLKPSNIVVRATDRQPVILDFGQAYIFDDLDTASLTTTAVGSLGYIPPEVIANPKLRTEGQDIFACGVLLYEIYCGRRPDPTELTSLAVVHPTLAPLDPIVANALAPASTRYPTARAFLADLDGVAL